MYDGTIKIDTSLDTTGISQGLSSIGGIVAKGMGAATAAIGALSVATIKLGTDFGTQMAEVGAISEASSEDMAKLTEKAKQMGAATKFSATESAQAFSYMAQAGWQTEQMLSGIEGVMLLAAASGEDLALTANVVTDSMTAFGLSASESAHFADVLAMAANASNTGVAELGESFKYVAPVAGAMGYSVEDVSVALGLMANQGIKASQAGTALRTLMTNLAKPTETMQKAMNDLGISLTDSAGVMKPLNVLMEDFREAFARLTPAQKAQYAATIAGKEGMSGLLAIVNASSQDFDTLTDRINNAAGAAQHAADIMNDTLRGDLDELSSAAEGLGLQLFESFEGPLRQAVQFAAEAINQLTASFSSGELKASIDIIGKAFADLVKGAASFAADALPMLINGFAFLVEHGSQVVAVLAGIVAGFAAFKAITVIDKLTTSFEAAKTAVTAWYFAQAAAQATQTASTVTLTAYQAVVGGLTGALPKLTAAQMALDAAMAASPAAVYAVAIGAVVVALGLLYAAGAKANENIKRIREEIQETIQASDALQDSISNSANTYSDSVAELEAQAGATKGLKDELLELMSVEDKSVAQKLRIQELVAQLNAIVPNLNLAYDEQADALNMTNEQLQLFIQNLEAATRAELEQERIKELYKERMDIERQLTDVQKTRSDTEKELAASGIALSENMLATERSGRELGLTSAKMSGDMKALSAEEAELTAQLAQNQTAIDGSTQSYLKWNAEVQKSTEAAATSGQTWYDVSMAMADAGGSMADVSKDMEESFRNIDAAATSMFDKIDEGTAQSFESIKATLEHNAAATAGYAENLSKLVEMDFDQAIITAVSKGSEFASQVEEMAKWSPEQVAAINASYQNAAQSSVDAQIQTFLAKTPDAREAASQIAQATVEALNNMEPGARESVMKAMDSMGVEFENGVPQFEGTAQGIVETLMAVLSTLPEEAKGPFEEAMTAAVEAVQQGESDTGSAAEGVKSAILTAIESLPEEQREIFKKAFEEAQAEIDAAEGPASDSEEAVKAAMLKAIESLPEDQQAIFKQAFADAEQAISDSEGPIGQASNKVGQASDDEMKSGIDSKKGEVIASTDAVVQGVVSSLDASKAAFRAAGESAGQGYADGIRSKIGAAISSGDAVVAAVSGAVQRAQDSHSPSKLFAKHGGDASSGYAAGVENKAHLGAEAAKNMTQGALDAVAKTQDSHSDSKIAAKLGGYLDSGYANSIIDNAGLASIAGGFLTQQALKPVEDGVSTFSILGNESGEKYSFSIYDTADEASKASGFLADSAVDSLGDRKGDFEKQGRLSGETLIYSYTDGAESLIGHASGRVSELYQKFNDLAFDKTKEGQDAIREENASWLDSILDNTTTDMVAVSKVIDKYNAEGWNAAAKYLDDYAKVENAVLKEQQKEQEKAAKSKKDTKKKSSDDEIAISKGTAKAVKEIEEHTLEQQIKIWDEIAKRAGDNADLRYRAELKSFEATKKLMDDMSKARELAADREAETYFELAEKFKDNERVKSEALQEGVRATKDAIDERMSYEHVSYEEQLGMYSELRVRVVDDMRARAEADKEYFEAAKGYVAERVELEGWGAGEIAGYWAKEAASHNEGTNLKAQADREFLKAKQDLAKEIEDIEQEYADALEKRTEQLANSFGLFEEISAKVIEKQDLFKALESQNATLSQWTNDIGSLTQRGLDEGLIAELQQMGPKSADQVRAMATMTDAELQRYAEMWRDKQRMAREHAVKELEPLRQECDEKIQNALNSAYGILEGAIDPMEDKGRAIVEGIAAGILDGSISVDDAIQQVVDSALATAQTAADAHSPARRFMPVGENIDEGMAVGMVKKGYTEKATSNIIDKAVSAGQSLSSQNLSALTQSALSFMGSRQAQLAATHSTYSTISNTSQEQGGDIIFQPGSIVLNEASISSDLDIKRVGRKLGDEFAREAWLKGVFNNDMG